MNINNKKIFLFVMVILLLIGIASATEINETSTNNDNNLVKDTTSEVKEVTNNEIITNDNNM